jgi:hypothetical protein
LGWGLALVHGTELEPLFVSASVFGDSAIEIGWDTVIARGAVLFHSLDTVPKILLRHITVEIWQRIQSRVVCYRTPLLGVEAIARDIGCESFEMTTPRFQNLRESNH